jgi:hypothetical protein
MSVNTTIVINELIFLSSIFLMNGGGAGVDFTEGAL